MKNTHRRHEEYKRNTRGMTRRRPEEDKQTRRRQEEYQKNTRRQEEYQKNTGRKTMMNTIRIAIRMAIRKRRQNTQEEHKKKTRTRQE